MSSIFKPRKFAGPIVKPSVTKAEELTKNKHYCVSRLPGLPSVFKTTTFVNAYSDSESKYAAAISNDSVYVWRYKSVDASPLSIQIPIDKSFKLPVAILTSPSSGTGRDPGLLLIDAITGLVKFYENVQRAPTLGLIHDKPLDLQVSLQPTECITLVENVEPAGIAVATSLRRCILISLRDYRSIPCLSTMELVSPERSFLAKLFVHDEGDIVAIRSAKDNSFATSQAIYVLTSAGTLYSVTCNSMTPNSTPYINNASSFKQTLSVDPDAYPGSGPPSKFLDIWPLKDNSYFLALVEWNSTLMLATFRADKSGALYYGSHDLKISNDSTSPRLFLPSTGKTAFVIMDKTIIMTDLDTSYIEPKNTFTYTKPRWEDVIRINPATKLIGYGYENQSPDSNPSVILITKNYGVLRLEKFPETPKKEIVYDTALLLKSHIEQGIFFSDSKVIDFDLIHKAEKIAVHNAVRSIIKEVMTSTSPYLPDTLPVTADLLQLKVKILTELIAYCQRNFPDDFPMIAEVVKNLEKTNCALNLWKYIDANETYMEVFRKIRPEPRQFFISEIENIGEVLNSFLDHLKETTLSTSSLVVTTIHDGVYLNAVRYSDEVGMSWLFDSEVLNSVESQFTQDFVIGNNSDKYDASCIVQVLYYFYTSAIKSTKEQRLDTQYEELSTFYAQKKKNWITALLKLGLVKEAKVLAEKYHDFASLARILDTERDSKSIEQLNYGLYFEEFGYPFAACVYEHYINNGEYQKLLLEFSNYKHFLLQYFKQNPESTSSVSWIRYLLDDDFELASKALGLAASYNKELINNQLTQLSLGKLSAIAVGASTKKQFDNELMKVRYQIKVRDVVAGGGRIAAIKKENFASQFLNKKIDKADANSIAANIFGPLSSDLRLNELLLIELLTVIEPKFLQDYGFVYALKVAQTFSNEEHTNESINIILLRLLTLGTEVKHTINGTDDVVKHEVESSILFKTLVSQPNIVSQLNQLLENVNLNDTLNPSLSEFDEKLLNELKKRLDDDSFRSWVHMVIEQAKIVII